MPQRRNGSARSSPTRAGRSTALPRSARSAGRHAIWRTCWPWSSRGCAQRSASAWSRGVGELEVAAPFEVYASSFAARTVPIAAEATVTTRHGLRLVATPANADALRIDRLMVPGVGRIEEVDAQLLGWAADRGLNVELPNGGQAAGQFSFDAMLGDLAGHSDQTTARVTAKSIEYPTEQLELAGAGWPWRPTALLALTATAAIGVALLPAAATRRNRR